MQGNTCMWNTKQLKLLFLSQKIDFLKNQLIKRYNFYSFFFRRKKRRWLIPLSLFIISLRDAGQLWSSWYYLLLKNHLLSRTTQGKSHLLSRKFGNRWIFYVYLDRVDTLSKMRGGGEAIMILRISKVCERRTDYTPREIKRNQREEIKLETSARETF